MLVQNFPQAFQEKHLLKGFSLEKFAVKNFDHSRKISVGRFAAKSASGLGTAGLGDGQSVLLVVVPNCVSC